MPRSSRRVIGRKRRDHDTRKRVVASATVVALTAGVVVAAVLYDGDPTADVELNDGGVWVTSSAEMRIGRVNHQIQLLDGSVAARSGAIDVLQESSTVLLRDEGADLVQQVDPASMTAQTSVPLPASSEVYLGGGVVAALDASTGRVHSAPADAIGILADEELEPVAQLGADAVVTVGPDGTTYGLSRGDARLVVAPAGFDPESDELEVHDLDIDPALLADADVQLTAVGDEPVVTVLTEAGDLRLLRPEEETLDLGSLVPEKADFSLQQPSSAFAEVVAATRGGLLRVPLSGGDPVFEEIEVPGTPAHPVVAAGCAHAAWSATSIRYEARCAGADVLSYETSAPSGDSQLMFRVNRDVVVLNDLLDGTVWLVTDAMEIVENWEDVTPPENPENTEDQESQQDILDTLPLDRDQENRDPIATDDEFGVRPGTTAVLEVLANDTDPDGDLLTVESFGAPSEGFGEIRPVLGGRALQIDVGSGASGAASLDYEISDGRGGSDTAVLRVSVVPEDVNSPPEQLRDITLRIAQGATGSVNIMSDVHDPDGDAVVVVGAEVTTDDTVRFTPDGTITFVDSGVETGLKPVTVTLSDGRDTSEIDIVVEVLPDASLPPIPVFDFYRAVVGHEEVFAPTENDVDPANQELRLADVEQAAGASVVLDHDANTFRFEAEAAGTFYLTYIVVNDAGASATGLIRIDAAEPRDAAPVAAQDTALLPAGQSVLVDVLANDEDPSGEVLAVQQVEAPGHLEVAVLDHRILRVSAAQELTDTVRLTYTVSNGSAQATGEVVVIPVPADSLTQPPVALPDVANVRAGDYVTVPVLSNDSHPGGLTFTLSDELVDAPEVGHMFVSGDVLRFRAPDEPQTVHAVYEIEDSAGQVASAQVTIHVQADDGERNSAPMPLPVEARAFAGERVRIHLPLYGVDPDGDSVELLGAELAPAMGRIVEIGPTYLDYEAFGRVTGTDEFTYAVRDRLGAHGAATVRVGIVPPPAMNRAPQAVDDEIHVRPGRVVEVDVLVNDIDPDGDPLYLAADPFDEVEELGVEQLDAARLEILTPEEEGTYTLAYRVTDQRGGQDTGILTVEVSEDAPLLPPVAVDDIVSAASLIGTERVTIPVLENDHDPDGSGADLSVELVEAPDTAEVVGDDVRVEILPERQILTYAAVDVDELRSYAFIDVPGLDDAGPVLRADLDPIEVGTGETIELELEDYVIAPSGNEVRLTDESKVRATNSDGSSPVLGPTTLTFTSAPTYSGPATLTFEVTDGESVNDPEGLTSVLTLDITVIPVDNQPPTFDGAAVELAPGEDGVTLNLRQLSDDPDPGDFNQLLFDLTAVPDGFTAELDGPNLYLEASVDTPRGTRETVELTVSDRKAEPVPGQVEITVVPSTRRLLTVQDVDLGELEQGESQTVDVLQGAYNPFPGESLRVVDAGGSAGAGVTFDASSVTVSAGDSHVGRATVSFTVEDVTADPDRRVSGTISFSVIGVPERPAPPRVEDVRDETVVLTWSAPQDNGSPITGYRVEGDGVSQECATTTCTITGLTNAREYRFQVIAINAVGESEPSGLSAVARPDVRPERPSAPRLEFGDGEIAVEWDTPATRGSAISSFDLQIAPSPGGGQASVSGNRYVWTGLTNGQAYQVRVRAHNDAPDPSDWSEWSASEVPAGVPDQPAAPVAERVDSPITAQITASWQAPANNGDAISEYDVTIRRDGSVFREFTVSGSTTSITEDAPAGSDYTVTVAARNKAGTSQASAASAPVRSFVKPDRVSSVEATETGENGQVRIAFSAPADNGDQIRRYDVRINGGSWSQVPSNRVITGLSNGSSYRFEVRACNTYCGDASPQSNSVVPYGPLANPTITASTTGGDNNRVRFDWQSPDGNGRDITRVELRIDNGSWETVSASGNRTTGTAWDTTFTGEIRVTRADGAQTSATASARTAEEPPPPPPPPPPPTTPPPTTSPPPEAPQPSVSIPRDRPAQGQPGCSHSSCAYLDMGYQNLPAGRYRVTFYENGQELNLHYNGNEHDLSGSGTLRLQMYYGYPNREIRVVADGPVRVEHAITW